MQLFGQIRKVIISDMIFDYSQFDIDFDIKEEEKNKATIATVIIYNLSEETKLKIRKGLDITVMAGYEEMNGVIFNGVIDLDTTTRDGADFATKIIATQNNRQYTNTIINRQFKAGIKASEIMKQLESISNYTVIIRELAKDTNYPSGKAFSNRLSNVVNILARDTGTIAVFTNDTIEFKLPNKAYTDILTLGAKQGLISVARKEQANDKKDSKVEMYEIESFLVPIIKIGQLLQIESTTYTGKAKVKKCNYIASGEDTHIVHALVEVVE